MKKLHIIFLLLFSIPGFSQFSTNQVIPDFLAAKNEDMESRKNFFLVDNSGNLISQPNLYDDIDLNSYELLSANLSFKDNMSTQKIVFAPFKLTNSNNLFLNNLKTNISLKNKITTIGIGVGGDRSSPYSKRSIKILKQIYQGLQSPTVPKDSTVTYEDYKKTVLAEYQKVLDSAYILYNKKRLKNVWKYTIGYNIQLYPNLAASGTANNFDSLNSYSVKSHIFSLSGSYSTNAYKHTLSGNLNFLWSRASAISGQEIQPYFGPSASYKLRILNFMNDRLLKKNENYKKDLFIPALYIGVAFEGKYYQGSDQNKIYIIDGIEEQTSVMLFFDVLISKSAQFRIGLPYISQKFVDTTTLESIGTTVQYNFKLVNLK
jgi:hypothetical protein